MTSRTVGLVVNAVVLFFPPHDDVAAALVPLRRATGCCFVVNGTAVGLMRVLGRCTGDASLAASSAGAALGYCWSGGRNRCHLASASLISLTGQK